MVTRMQRKRLLFIAQKTVVLHLLLGLALISGLCCYCYGRWAGAAVPVAAQSSSIIERGVWRELLFWGVPGLARVSAAPYAANGQNEGSVYRVLGGALDLVAGIDSGDLRSILRAEVPVLALVPETPTKRAKSAATAQEKLKLDPILQTGGKPLVGVYHTHTAESFIPSTGVAHRPGGQRGEICDVGKALVETLAKKGIPAIQDTTIHDSPSFMKAYGASEVTVKRMVQENPSLQMVFDVHRDAEKRASVSAEVAGQTVACMSIIVAQGQQDLPQPHWQQNYALAKLIDEKCNEKYPGLSRGIQLVEWRYNQHLHPHALLLEIGSHETSTEEGERTMAMLADVLADILKEAN